MGICTVQTKNLSHFLVHVSALFFCLPSSEEESSAPRSTDFFISTKIASPAPWRQPSALMEKYESAMRAVRFWVNEKKWWCKGCKAEKKVKQIGSRCCWWEPGPGHSSSIKVSSKSQNISSYTNYLAYSSFNWVCRALHHNNNLTSLYCVVQPRFSRLMKCKKKIMREKG